MNRSSSVRKCELKLVRQIEMIDRSRVGTKSIYNNYMSYYEFANTISYLNNEEFDLVSCLSVFYLYYEYI